MTMKLLKLALLIVALAASAQAAEAPSPEAACDAFLDAVRDDRVSAEPLMRSPSIATAAAEGCAELAPSPERDAALGLALTAVGDASGVDLLRTAAEAGLIEAQYWLALWSKEGLALDGRALLAPNDRRFLRFLTKAAQGGHADAQVLLGVSYAEGMVVVRDQGEARRWFERAAGQEHPRGLYLLGSMLLRGDESPDSFDDGMALIERSAELGDPYARWLLAQTTLSDNSVRTTAVDEALRTLHELARNRFELAIITLGMAYMEGVTRVRQDETRARAVFCQAGALGADLHERLYLEPLSCEGRSSAGESKQE